MKVTERIIRSLRGDWSALALLASNLFTIVVAVADDWDLGIVMWVYWGQSVIIGLLNAVKIWTLEDFTTEGFTSGGNQVPATTRSKRQTAAFFLFHYGFFHFVYVFFLTSRFRLADADRLFVGLCLAGFFLSHLFSLRFNRPRDSRRKPNLGRVMFFPYARILPMHLTMIFGFAFLPGVFVMVLFLLLKTAADLIMHAVEHAGET